MYRKTRERGVECDGVSVARGRRALDLLDERGFEKSLAMGRTSLKITPRTFRASFCFSTFSPCSSRVHFGCCFFPFLHIEARSFADKCRLCSHYRISLAEAFTIDSCEIFTWSHKALNWGKMRFWGLLEDKDFIISTFLYLFQTQRMECSLCSFSPVWLRLDRLHVPPEENVGQKIGGKYKSKAGFRQFISFRCSCIYRWKRNAHSRLGWYLHSSEGGSSLFTPHLLLDCSSISNILILKACSGCLVLGSCAAGAW